MSMNAALADINATRMPTVATLLVLIAVPAKKVSLGMDVRVQVDQLSRRTCTGIFTNVQRLIMPDFSFVIVDIDECSYGIHICDVNAYCTNTFGSYSCFCRAGFRSLIGLCSPF